MMQRESLSREHAEIGQLAADLLACLHDDAPDLERIGRIRWCMTRKLSAHLTKEDQLLYPRMRSGPDRRAAEVANRFAREMGGLSDAYRIYMTGWTAETILARWPTFVIETRAVMQALGRRIQLEEAELYPLLGAAAA